MGAVIRNANLAESAPSLASKSLTASVNLWFLTAVAGQLVFAIYIAGFYGRATLSGDLAAWNKVMPHGYIPGDTAGNFAVGMHLLLALIITLGGALQLVPQIRRHAPTFHRWNGRLYISTAFLISLIGLYMVWTRGAVGDLTQHIGISINAVLIMLCALQTVRYARARKLAVHRRWALRLFIVASGVWFFRVGLMLWLALNGGPVGFDPHTFTGPFLNFLSFAQYLIPLGIVELYIRATGNTRPAARWAMAALLLIASIGMGAGIVVTTLGMWLPRL